MNKRRQWLLTAAAGAVGLGAALAWQWRRLSPPIPPAGLAQLWSSQWQGPENQDIAMNRFQGQALVVNFWATWCPPCVEEMPLLDAFYRENRDKRWQMIGLAIDQPSRVRQFLNQYPVSYPIALAGLDGSELMRALGNEAGALPYTVVLNAKGEVHSTRLGRLSEAEIKAWAEIKL
jgi:thiol-disulfide isomerase/thioredoxin